MTKEQIEKIEHGIDSCGFHEGIVNACNLTECPYRENRIVCVHQLIRDAGLYIQELKKKQTGHWIRQRDRTLECSVCGSIAPYDMDYYGNVISASEFNYCPDCGAKMKGDT